MKHPIFLKEIVLPPWQYQLMKSSLAWTLNQLNLRRFSVGCHSNGNLAKVHDRKWCRCHHPCLRERVGRSATFGILGSGRLVKWCLPTKTEQHSRGSEKGEVKLTTWSLTDWIYRWWDLLVSKTATNNGSFTWFTCCWDDGFISSSWLIFICWYYLNACKTLYKHTVNINHHHYSVVFTHTYAGLHINADLLLLVGSHVTFTNTKGEMDKGRMTCQTCQTARLDILKDNSETVDGWNPAPPGMYETLWIMGYLPYQLVQDFSH